MAIITFTNYKRGQTAGCMGAVMRYTMQEKKTLWDGQRLVTGVNCEPDAVYADFMATKKLYHKTDGKLFYQMVQSFPKGASVDPVTAHAAALRLAEYFSGHEVLVCTHVDREHIHSHFVINSVNFDTGKKLHIAKEQLQELRQRNDAVCLEFSLPVFTPDPNRNKSKIMTTGEYHTAARGQSKKLQLMNIINDCMRHASTREEFIALMESEGCKVRWEKSRKNITYTTPSGWQCRDRMLFGDKYLKENMEYEFRIRAEVIHGRADGVEPTLAGTAGAGDTATGPAAHRDPLSPAGSGGASDGITGEFEFVADRVSEATVGDALRLSIQIPDGRAAEIGETFGANGRTGWEAEREIFLSSPVSDSVHSLGQSAPLVSDAGNHRSSLVGDVVQLGYTLERDQTAVPVIDSTTKYDRADSKLLRREKEKKIALGHKADDHEEEQTHTWQQTM